MSSKRKSKRLQVVDALRGFAIVSIMLLHNLEHFDVYFLPPDLPDWMVGLDKKIWDGLFFLFAGKSYAIFALLFGLTFFIQSNNQEKIGADFRGRFVWRLILLFGFGVINSAFYQGDILTIYALMGIFLIPVAKLSDKAVFLIAFILLLQPLEWIGLFQTIQNPEVALSDPRSWEYFGKMSQYIYGDSFIDTVKGNLTNGKLAVVHWSYENGRFLHILSLFMFGMLAGRKNLFQWSEKNKQFWVKTWIGSLIAYIPLFMLQKNMANMIVNQAMQNAWITITTLWANLAFMLVLVSGFVLLFHTKKFYNAFNVLSPIGSMSLTNYIMQSMVGATIYYGFGFGLYQYTGATYSVLIGVVLAIGMGYFSTWWMKKFKRGPLETYWHKATWIFKKNKKENKVMMQPVS